MDKNLKIIVGSILFFVLMGSPACDICDELGNGYFYMNRCINSPHDSIRFVPSRVLDYKWDNQYIIAKQKFEDSGYRNGDLKNRVYFEQPPYDEDSVAFWLIDKYANYNYGPMSALTFDELCKQKGVTLKFESESLIESLFKFINKRKH